MTNPVPTPNDANIPLIQGIDSSWNDFVKYVPEDKRSELVPLIQQRHTEYETLKGKYASWEKLDSNGIDAEAASKAVDLVTFIENNPNTVYEALGRHLGVTPQEAEKMVDEEVAKATSTPAPAGHTVDFDINNHPDFVKMRDTVQTLAQVTLAEKQEAQREAQIAEATKELEKEFSELKSKYGEFPEDEVLMRMQYKNMTAEEAYQEWDKTVSSIRQRRPAPFVLSNGGQVPRGQIDVKKLSDKDAKNLALQNLLQANAAAEG